MVRGTPAKLETPNYERSLELILARKDGDRYFSITNDEQDAPWKIAFNCNEMTNTIQINVSFSFEKADPYQTVYFYDFIEHAKKENRLMVRRTIDGKVLLETSFGAQFPALPESSINILRMLADVQLITGIRFRTPDRMSKEELQILSRLHQIMKSGMEEGKLQSLTVDYSQEQARRRLYLAENPQIVENFQVNLGDQSLALLGRPLRLVER